MNRYLEKLAFTIDVDSSGKPHQFYGKGSTFDNRASAAKNINLTPAEKHKLIRSAKIGTAAVIGAGASLYAGKKLIEKVREKRAAMDPELKRDIAHTASIGAVGFGTGMLSAAIGHKIPKIGKSVAAAGALSGTLGLIGDYGAVKLNKKIDKKI